MTFAKFQFLYLLSESRYKHFLYTSLAFCLKEFDKFGGYIFEKNMQILPLKLLLKAVLDQIFVFAVHLQQCLTKNHI